MGHSANEPAPAQDSSPLKSVLVVCGDELNNISDTDVWEYMKTREESGGGPVERVDKQDHFTYIVVFLDHKDAVIVVRRDHHSIKGFSARVFLFDEQNMTVYSGHQTISSPDEEKKRVLQAPTTVLLHGHIFFKWDFTADDIKAHMGYLGNGGCRVNRVHCPDRAGIAFVEFERAEDALKVVNMEEVTLAAGGNEWPVSVILLRPLPSDPADIPNTKDTATDGMPAITARVGLTQALEWNHAPGAPVAPPHDSRSMQTGIKSGTSRAESKFQKEKDRVQDQTEEPLLLMKDQTETVRDNCKNVLRVHDQKEKMRRMQDRWGEALRRMTDEAGELRREKEAENKAQIKARAKMQSNMLSLEARLQSAVTQPQARLRSTVSQLETQVTSGFTNVKDEVSQPKSDLIQRELDITQLRDDMAQLRDDLNASELTAELRDTKMTAKLTRLCRDLEDHKTQWQAWHNAHLKGEWSFGPTIEEVANKHLHHTLWWEAKMLY